MPCSTGGVGGGVGGGKLNHDTYNLPVVATAALRITYDIIHSNSE